MKVANVRLGWTPSVSADVFSQKITVIIDGVEKLSSEVGPEISEVIVDVNASQSVLFSVLTTDKEGNETQSEVYNFTLSDLVPPQPATNLFHEVLSVRDADVAEPDPVVEEPAPI